MSKRPSSSKHRLLLYGFFFSFLAGLFSLGLSVLIPRLITARYYEKSLGTLRKQAQAIKREFAALESRINVLGETLLRSPLPLEKDKIFRLFEEIEINPETDGLAYFDQAGELSVWLGNVIDFRPDSPDSSFIIRRKASVYLVSALEARPSEYIIIFRLLAFLPQLKAPYLEDYHFLEPNLRRNCHIDYWDFREDVSGFEKIFARHKDEYIGEPRLQNEIQTIFFPLRNIDGKIVATVNLSSPSLLSTQSSLRENLLFVFIVFLLLSLVLLVSHLAKAHLFAAKKKTLPLLLLFLSLAGLRLLFFPLGQLEKVQSLPSFSPALAGFFSVAGLTQSPADIFLTSLFLFLITGAFALLVRPLFNKGRPLPLIPAAGLNILIIAAGIAIVVAHEKTVSRLVSNSSLNLLRFRPGLAFLLLHLSLVLFFLSLGLLLFLLFRASQVFSSRLWKIVLALIILSILLRFIFEPGQLIILLFLEAAVLVFIFFVAGKPCLLAKTEVVFIGLVLIALFNTALLRHESTSRLRSLLQTFLPDSVVSQENWADFLLRQSIPTLERRREAIEVFLQNPGPAPLARSLWESTLAAKFNWYSTLEILGPDGDILSRFSLNIPQLYRPEIDLPLNPTWTVSRLTIPSLGKEREFVFSYKDWFSQETCLGRTVFYMAVDPEMLPFLYSANPYFELLKVSTLPSLHQEEFGFAIFDSRGKILFNPNKISSGISPDNLELLTKSRQGFWSVFRDKGKTYNAFSFRLSSRIYSFFHPRPGFMSLTVEFLKLFSLYLGLGLFIFLFSGAVRRKGSWKSIFWSFSSRVHAAFIAITLTALLLFSFFSHSFFTRLFSQRFVEKAEVHANFARNVMQDFIFLQQEERATLIAPADDLVLWISSAIANDVNLYSEGRLVSSSRREFFDWGLLPELVDGETYYRIRHENKPFHTQRQKIGSYSFQSLTIPYTIHESQFLISLPFPFEEEEIAKATEELVEFLVFISVFFIGLTLLFARAMGRMIISPVKKLLTGTREVSLGNLDISIEHESRDEMKTLIDGFNTMTRNLKRHQQEIAELSKKAAWAEMAQKIAHEIKNPLTPIQLSAEHLLRVYEDRQEDFERAIKESVSYIISEVENLRKIAQEFLELSKATSLKKESFDLKEVVSEVISPYKKMLSERIKLREVYEGKAFPLLADKGRIKIAFRNIFINAIEAIRGKGIVEIRLAADREGLILQVRDSGQGMEKEVLDKIFDPYFSTKDVGTGLGLPIAKKIIEDHGGSIRVESQIGRGTAITIRLPCA